MRRNAVGGAVVLFFTAALAASAQTPAPPEAAKPKPVEPGSESTGGEQLSAGQVAALPLNKRDFSQLLLLAAGAQTDINGAANFTQQFTINGQRGSATVFAMDGVDTTDPEMGGATFSNFNVDAIQEIRSSSGVMPAEIGHGAAGFTEVITRSGANALHGSLFEFVRNAAFDARNFFDRRSVAQPGRIPPFVRNEFGFTNGGAIRRNRVYYFGQYQGFRQTLGTTQILPVPSPDERLGRDTTAFPGDTLFVPVDSRIAPVLARYPLPNDPQGPYGPRTYAASSKVRAVTDQFSIRIDHKLSSRGQLFGRFSLNNVDGPTTNASQTAIDPSFGIRFLDHQRNAAIGYTRAQSPALTFETWLGYIRSTPLFPAGNSTQPGLVFNDGLYEGFNAASGSIMGAYGNLYQIRQNVAWTRGKHAWKAGGEARVNRDVTVFGTNPNGTYTFGGGAAYSPVAIRSASGAHNIAPGDPLPDTLSGLLTATPFSYTITAAPALFAQGSRLGLAGVRRQAYNFFVQDTWKAHANLTLAYGLRYEVDSRIGENARRTSGFFAVDDAGRHIDPLTAGAKGVFLISPDPHYRKDWGGWSPRLVLDWKLDASTVFRAGGSVTTGLVNLWQQNTMTGGMPYVFAPLSTAEPGRPVSYSASVIPVRLPQVYSISGQPLYPNGRSTDPAPNTRMDLLRFERDLAALSSDGQIRALSSQGADPDLGNGAIASWTAGIERAFGDVTATAAYVATAGMRLGCLEAPNGYAGAGPEFAPYTVFDSQGRVQGGFGPVYVSSSHSHSTYHSLQTSVSKNSLRAGLGFQASYTFSRSIDDTSAILGGFLSGAAGAVLQTSPQNPHNRRAEKASSTFDVNHVFTFSAIQEVSLLRVAPFLPKRAHSGWQLLAMGTLASGSPFTVFSGIQQTAAGANGADRPDQVAAPVLSTNRSVREDYFGRGGANASFFNLPVNLPDGAGPNHGRFGALGRNTFRAPGLRNFDFSAIKNTPIGRGANPERVVLQFRAEVFNAFNLVNLAMPNNVVTGPGFGLISRTAAPSRQIQFSLKLLY